MPLPWCDQCGMQMPTARMGRHRRTARCNRATDMRLRQIDIDMSEILGGMEFNLYGREGGDLVEGMVQFKYLGLPLDKTDYYWPAVRRNVKRARRVWGRLGKMLQREGADIKVS